MSSALNGGVLTAVGAPPVRASHDLLGGLHASGPVPAPQRC